jgi:hypothetical protein
MIGTMGLGNRLNLNSIHVRSDSCPSLTRRTTVKFLYIFNALIASDSNRCKSIPIVPIFFQLCRLAQLESLEIDALLASDSNRCKSIPIVPIGTIGIAAKRCSRWHRSAAICSDLHRF